MAAAIKYPPGTPCLECHQILPIMAKGLCKKCYMRLWARKKSGGISRQEYLEKRVEEQRIRKAGICKTCSNVGKIFLSNQCRKCYRKAMGHIIKCAHCGNKRKHEARGLCSSCYVNLITAKRKSKKIICAICGKLKLLKAKSLCQSCYTKHHKKTWNKKLVICLECKQEVEHEANGLCMKCYFQSVNGRKYNQARLAKKNGLPATLTDNEWAGILKRYNYSCAYCKKNDKPLHQEHWIPLSRGGGYTADNIVPACKNCNSRKHTMTGDEFLEFLKKESEWETMLEF